MQEVYYSVIGWKSVNRNVIYYKNKFDIPYRGIV